MTVIWTSIAKKSYAENIEFLLNIWNLKIAQDFILEVEKVMVLISSQPTIFEKWEFDENYQKDLFTKMLVFIIK